MNVIAGRAKLVNKALDTYATSLGDSKVVSLFNFEYWENGVDVVDTGLFTASYPVDLLISLESSGFRNMIDIPNAARALDHIYDKYKLREIVPPVLLKMATSIDGTFRRLPLAASADAIICNIDGIAGLYADGSKQATSPHYESIEYHDLVDALKLAKERAGAGVVGIAIPPPPSSFKTALLIAMKGASYAEKLSRGEVPFISYDARHWLEELEELHDSKIVTHMESSMSAFMALSERRAICAYGAITLPMFAGVNTDSNRFLKINLDYISQSRPKESPDPGRFNARETTVSCVWGASRFGMADTDAFFETYIHQENERIKGLMSGGPSLAGSGGVTQLAPLPLFQNLPSKYKPLADAVVDLLNITGGTVDVTLGSPPMLSKALESELDDVLFKNTAGLGTGDIVKFSANDVHERLEMVRVMEVLGQTPPPVVSVGAGTYHGAISVEIKSAGEDSVIRYTLDGTKADAASPLYLGPITISTEGYTILRCFARVPGLAPSEEVSVGYVISRLDDRPGDGGVADPDMTITDNKLSRGYVALIALSAFLSVVVLATGAFFATRTVRWKRKIRSEKKVSQMERLENAARLETLNRNLVVEVNERRDLEKKLKREARVREQFIANMSHELRTPIHGVRLGSQLLLSSNLDDEQSKIVSSIESSASLLLAIVNDVLDLSLIEEGKFEFKFEVCDVKAVLESCVRLVAPGAAEKGVDMHAIVLPGVPDAVITDPTRLMQAVLNYLSNAIKFTQRGGSVVAVLRYESVMRTACNGHDERELNARFSGSSSESGKSQDGRRSVTFEDRPVRSKRHNDSHISSGNSGSNNNNNNRNDNVDGPVPALVRNDSRDSAGGNMKVGDLRGQRKMLHATRGDSGGSGKSQSARDASSPSAARGTIIIEVKDTGCGLSPSLRTKLFKRFSQVDHSDSRAYGGTGLGLYITKKIARGLGGKVGVRSLTSKGSAFFLTVPVVETDAPVENNTAGISTSDIELALTEFVAPVPSKAGLISSSMSSLSASSGKLPYRRKPGIVIATCNPLLAISCALYAGEVGESIVLAEDIAYSEEVRRRLGPLTTSLPEGPRWPAEGSPFAQLLCSTIIRIPRTDGRRGHSVAGSGGTSSNTYTTGGSGGLAGYNNCSINRHMESMNGMRRGGAESEVSDGSDHIDPACGRVSPESFASGILEVIESSGTAASDKPRIIVVDEPVAMHFVSLLLGVTATDIGDLEIIVLRARGKVKNQLPAAPEGITLRETTCPVERSSFLRMIFASLKSSSEYVASTLHNEQSAPVVRHKVGPIRGVSAADDISPEPRHRDVMQTPKTMPVRRRVVGGNIDMDAEAGMNLCGEHASPLAIRMTSDVVKRRSSRAESTAGGTSPLSLARSNTDPLATGNDDDKRNRKGSEDVCEKSRRILIAEDNPLSAKLLSKLLKRLGASVVCAENGKIAVREYQRMTAEPEGLDLILMDCQMPVMTGYEATSKIRALEKQNNSPRTLIIALTAASRGEDKRGAFDAGMDDFYSKPINVKEIEGIVKNLGKSKGTGSPTKDAML